MAGLEGHRSRSAVYLIHKAWAGAGHVVGASARRLSSRKGMLSHAQCERPVTWTTRQGNRIGIAQPAVRSVSRMLKTRKKHAKKYIFARFSELFVHIYPDDLRNKVHVEPYVLGIGNSSTKFVCL